MLTCSHLMKPLSQTQIFSQLDNLQNVPKASPEAKRSVRMGTLMCRAGMGVPAFSRVRVGVVEGAK